MMNMKTAPKNSIVTLSFHSIDSFLSHRWMGAKEKAREREREEKVYEFDTNETMYEQR